jgi:polyhydroxybutyrate depolymerase
VSGGSGGAGAGGGGSKSAGCGKAAPMEGRRTITSGGMNREYVLALPNNYDPNRAYRLIFTWHWRGGNANDVVNSSVSLGPYYGLESRSGGSAIFVSPEGLVDSGVSGWANPQGRDIQFLRDMLTYFNANLCIDQQRIFSTGFSYGGMMSIAVGCALGGTFRAIAPFSGAAYSGCEAGTNPVAFWGAHGTAGGADGVVPIANGRSARDEFLERNGCGTTTMAVSPSPCVTYQGCRAGYPVTWCEFNGAHTTWAPESQAVWDFFAQF